MKNLSIIVLTFLLFAIKPYAQSQKVRIEKKPSWVNSFPIDYGIDKLDNEAEDGYVDLDFEKQVLLASQSVFIKKSIRVISESGVQNSSEISLGFDPSYQELIFHTVRVIRNGQSINKLQLSKIKTIQQEKDLGKHVYNGSLTAFLLLEDVRKGDIIEYSYTLKGFNPIYGNKYAHFFETRYSVPVYNLYYRLIAPAGRTFYIKNSQEETRPVVQQLAGSTTYEWKINNVTPLRVQDHVPAWFDPYPMIMVSEFKSWSEIAEWARKLFPFNLQLSQELKTKIEDIKKSNISGEARILAALHFVQDDIRYMGIEMGESSMRPSHPNKIIMQRFGDCKDKSYLLCTMLRAMGIEADPVLINTSYKKALANWLPSPLAFDHCTVRVKLNGSVHWFDPTIPYQRGGLKDIAYPDYQDGFVVTDTTASLTSIPLQDNGWVNVKEVFTVPDLTGTAHLMVKTEYRGSFADDARGDFKSNSRYEMQKKYQKYYGAYFENMTADSLSYDDNERTGVFTTKEQYTITHFWEMDKQVRTASFSPYTINGLLKKPADIDRTMPYSLDYPTHYKEEIEINLPEDWHNMEESSGEIKSPASVFKYHYLSASARQLRLQYEYQNLRDYVDAKEFSKYFDCYKRIDNHAGYELTWNEGVTSAENTTTASSLSYESSSPFSMLYALLGLCVLVTIMVRRHRRQSN